MRYRAHRALHSGISAYAQGRNTRASSPQSNRGHPKTPTVVTPLVLEREPCSAEVTFDNDTSSDQLEDHTKIIAYKCERLFRGKGNLSVLAQFPFLPLANVSATTNVCA